MFGTNYIRFKTTEITIKFCPGTSAHVKIAANALATRTGNLAAGFRSLPRSQREKWSESINSLIVNIMETLMAVLLFVINYPD